MKLSAARPLSHQIFSKSRIFFTSLLCGCAVIAGSVFLQWLVYDDWLHRSGIRVVGSLLAGVLTYAFSNRFQLTIRERRIEMLGRFETIARMNDQIRNALQVIECATYATNPQATEPVRNAVDRIEGILEEVLISAHPSQPRGKSNCINFRHTAAPL